MGQPEADRNAGLDSVPPHVKNSTFSQEKAHIALANRCSGERCNCDQLSGPADFAGSDQGHWSRHSFNQCAVRVFAISISGRICVHVRWLVGGSAKAFDRVRPVLSILVRDAIHLGPTGSGALMKLIKFLAAVQAISFGEAVSLIQAGFLPRKIDGLNGSCIITDRG
jgi:hypothetical protein